MFRKKIEAISFTLILVFVSGCARQPQVEETAQAKIAAQPVQVSTEKTDAAEPSLASAPDGSVYVAWVEHRPQAQADVFLKKLNADGTPNSLPVRINPEEGKATAWFGDPPSMAVAADGAVHVMWAERVATKGHENNLYLSTSRDGGKSFDAPVKINDETRPVVHGMHSLALDKDGGIHLLWLDERNLSPAAPKEKHRGEAHEIEPNREVFSAYSEDGGRTISRNQLVGRDACPCCKTALVAGTDGRVYAGWRQVLKGDYRHIAVASSADKGQTFSSPVIVSDDRWVIAGCPVSGPSLLVRDDGKLRVLWYTKGEAGAEGLYFTQSSDGGRTFSGRQLISRGNVRGNPRLVIDASRAGQAIAIWQAGDGSSPDMMRAEIATDGTIMGSIAAMSKGELPASAASNGQLVTAYISKTNNQRSIWLLRSNTTELAGKS